MSEQQPQTLQIPTMESLTDMSTLQMNADHAQAEAVAALERAEAAKTEVAAQASLAEAWDNSHNPAAVEEFNDIQIHLGAKQQKSNRRDVDALTSYYSASDSGTILHKTLPTSVAVSEIAANPSHYETSLANQKPAVEAAITPLQFTRASAQAARTGNRAAGQYLNSVADAMSLSTLAKTIGQAELDGDMNLQKFLDNKLQVKIKAAEAKADSARSDRSDLAVDGKEGIWTARAAKIKEQYKESSGKTAGAATASNPGSTQTTQKSVTEWTTGAGDAGAADKDAKQTKDGNVDDDKSDEAPTTAVGKLVEDGYKWSSSDSGEAAPKKDSMESAKAEADASAEHPRRKQRRVRRMLGAEATNGTFLTRTLAPRLIEKLDDLDRKPRWTPVKHLENKRTVKPVADDAGRLTKAVHAVRNKAGRSATETTKPVPDKESRNRRVAKTLASYTKNFVANMGTSPNTSPTTADNMPHLNGIFEAQRLQQEELNKLADSRS